jgi:hypothetical protein
VLNPEIYTWYAAYHAAVLEPDSANMPNRVDTALKGIEDRLAGPAQIDDAEQTAIAEARARLAAARSRAGSRIV